MLKYIFNDYNKYLENQKEKTLSHLSSKRFLSRDQKLIDKFYKRNEHLKKFKSGGKVLCIGARSGVEVEAFIKLGYEAIGIDLIAWPPNVIEMDMMDMKFDYKFDMIYTNSIDHCYNMVKFTEQIKNNIKPDGLIAIDFIHNKWQWVGGHESVDIGCCDDIIKVFKDNGFKFIDKFHDLPRRYFQQAMIEDQLIFKIL